MKSWMLNINKLLGHIHLNTKEGKSVLEISQATANLAQVKLLGHFSDYKRDIKQSEIRVMLKDLSEEKDIWSTVDERR